ncbi:MAG: mechanosensitive ion channel [Bacteroidetes bacterium]|nr:mechanosensitive ion channel [Bacteroidota bacterium]
MNKYRKQLLQIGLLFIYAFSHLLVSGQNVNDSTAKAADEQIPDLSNINYEIGKLELSFKKYEAGLSKTGEIALIDTVFTKYEKFLKDEAKDFRGFNPNNLSKFFLESSYRLWEGYLKKLTGWDSQVNSKFTTAQTQLDELNETIIKWKEVTRAEFFQNEPKELQKRIQTVINDAVNYRERYSDYASELIKLEDRISEATNFCNDIIADILQLQKNRQDSLMISTEPAIWQIKLGKEDFSSPVKRLNKFVFENKKTLQNYLETKDFTSTIIIELLLIILFFAVRRAYLRKGFDDSIPGYKGAHRIFVEDPYFTIIVLMFVGFHLNSPYYPLLVNYLLSLVSLFAIRFILREFTDQRAIRYIDALLILFVLNILEIVFWYFGDIARLYLLIEAVAGFYIMSRFVHKVKLKRFFKEDTLRKGIAVLAIYSSILYVIAIVTNLFGLLDLSVLILKMAIRVPEFSVVLFGIYKILTIFLSALITLGRTSRHEHLMIYWDVIEKRLIQVLGVIGVFYWFLSFTISLEVSREVIDAIGNFLIEERSIGTMQITFGSLISLILILIVTYLLAGFLKVLIEHVILRNARLPRGVPMAISVTIRYFLITLGVLFALSAAGIDLGKFSILAGALGVGIGFGLQNIVNNFISGLILIYERPLNVGDTIEVENLLGRVNRIGIRSSNVKTYDGAEVVVPNGNLISNQLINWTLSDNQRRIEIKVGVAYGSDPNVVIELLEKVARENEDVLKEPAPWALFEEFGDSSLNFRLLFWVPYDIGIGTKSKVAVGIYNIFKENGVEIPFPQVDLHVKDTPDNKGNSNPHDEKKD